MANSGRDPSIFRDSLQTVSAWIKHCFAPKLKGPPSAETQKCAQIAIGHLTPKRATTLSEDYVHNLDFIFSMTPSNLDAITAYESRLEIDFFGPDLGKAKQVIAQTVRQARGQLIDAQHGYIVKEKALYTLNRLLDHLRTLFPDWEPKDPGSPVRILSRTYQNQSPLPPELAKEAQAKRAACDARIQSLRSTLLYKGLASQGINPSRLVTQEETMLAVEKRANERAMGQITAACLRLDPKQWPKFAVMGGVGELIAADLSQLLGGRLGVSLAARTQGTTLHAFAENIGSLFQVFQKSGLDKQTFLATLPTRPAQEFIMSQLVLGMMDGHANNVLLDKVYRPIPIDFGRALGCEPLHPYCNLQSCFFDWPAMDIPLSTNALAFWQQLDIDHIMDQLEDAVIGHFRDVLEDPDVNTAVMGTLHHLEMRLITLQEAALSGMTTLREMTALFVPPIFPYNSSAFEGLSKDQIYPAVARYIAMHGFKHAYKQSKADAELFRKAIQEEIRLWKGLPKETLYGPEAQKWYGLAHIDRSTFEKVLP